ncbi:Crp/Fnr family transcriptional regulator [Vannielia litorea]|uniref:Crp/Fnr family transcriptional regulator n=1 Tax=Vannielia TaxID=2813041 RepID=UPI001C980ABA|nr:Crp/Fnr family transcriptional regulator [Vannielia litorea]MBY6046965.1 Crp/Fnr family transcriptional regulator [Vannielia litorea]MBY6074379.1 Crp/Fnr family transcriptional regulator [Vannielia litorea]MBY6153114.1 Crp/Fnr family transcriptional regulator [Vannielia litorea]
MATSCQNCPLRKKPIFKELSSHELRFMSEFKSGELTVEPGTPILMEGSNSPQLYTALRGMGLRYKLLESGERQVVNFVFPGDFLGLQAAVMGEMGHSVEASTAMTLCVFDRNALWEFFRSHPERAFDVTWIAAEEEHFMGEALLSVGQRNAVEAIAWALVKMHQRGEALGLTRNGEMHLPYRQQDLADALGLSLVHTNKSLAKLRDRQLATWRNGRLALHDIEQLRQVAKLDEEAPRVRPLM